MNITELRNELSHRLSLHINDEEGLTESWNKLTSILSENISETITFFLSQCTDEEFFWLSEVFSDVSARTQSKEFVHALRIRLSKVSRDTYDQNNFTDNHMKEWVDYDEYIRSVNLEIEYAEGELSKE